MLTRLQSPWPRLAAAFLMAHIGLLVGTSVPAHASAPHPARRHEYKKEVEALEEQWRTAQLTDDVAAMDRLLSEDYVGISINGQVYTKAQQLERLRERLLVLTRLDLGEMKVKLVGHVAIVTSSATVAGTNNGIPLQGRYRYLRVYQRNPDGNWKITSFEITRISNGTDDDFESSHPKQPKS